MNFWQSLSGFTEAELTSADPAGTLDAISKAGISLYWVVPEGELSLRFRLSRRDWPRLREICRSRGDSLRLTGRMGLYWKVKALRRRPALLMGVVFYLALVLWLPTRVLFFQVEGNESVPARQILEAAEACGIRFGASRRQIRSEKMKNALLGALPQLQWAGINTSGCRAVISVREREALSDAEESPEITSIVAVRDGYLISCTVTSGNALCAEGQTVKAGQTLISPYTDCGISIRVTAAEGEVFAETMHKIRTVTLAEGYRSVSEGEKRHIFSILLGKKRINLWKDSGISPATCGRMYAEYYITLPGGFVLPLGMAVETVTFRETEVFVRDAESACVALSRFARETVMKQMIAGNILSEEVSFAEEPGRFALNADFLCTEMIGRENRLKIGEFNEQNS